MYVSFQVISRVLSIRTNNNCICVITCFWGGGGGLGWFFLQNMNIYSHRLNLKMICSRVEFLSVASIDSDTFAMIIRFNSYNLEEFLHQWFGHFGQTSATFEFNAIHLKMLTAKWLLYCSGLS